MTGSYAAQMKGRTHFPECRSWQSGHLPCQLEVVGAGREGIFTLSPPPHHRRGRWYQLHPSHALRAALLGLFLGERHMACSAAGEGLGQSGPQPAAGCEGRGAREGRQLSLTHTTTWDMRGVWPALPFPGPQGHLTPAPLFNISSIYCAVPVRCRTLSPEWLSQWGEGTFISSVAASGVGANFVQPCPLDFWW